MSSDGLFVEKQLSYSRASTNPTCDQKAWCEYAVFLTCYVGQHYCCLLKVLKDFVLSSVVLLFLARGKGKIATGLKQSNIFVVSVSKLSTLFATLLVLVHDHLHVGQDAINNKKACSVSDPSAAVWLHSGSNNFNSLNAAITLL